MTQRSAREIGARRRAARREHYRARLLGVSEMLELLGVSRRTWQEWRACGKGPDCYKLPNGRVVCREDDFDRWLESLREEAEVRA
ncbi:helix-turn-helix transcriptional regulator [Glycomyces sp. MUSA5-2]|uniref:helix-turn-helix transcriptional regulator n=1 Tax=Glycomyces sp. MUSA5-2 TaxID=2053002 RepID=UPI003009652C